MLRENLSDIPDVTAWAGAMGLSRSYFSTRFKLYFGEPPKARLRIVRYRQTKKKIQKYPNETSDSIADRVGLRNQQALYKFLARHYDTNFTEVRHKVLTERRP